MKKSLKMSKYISILTCILALFFTVQIQAQTDIYKDIEFNMPKVLETSFPNKSVNIKDFGAKPDGIFKNTKAINDAISDINKKGGGKVIVPRGIWLTGPIYFKSNVNLHLEDGALILFSRDFDDYPLIETSFEGLNTTRNTSPIMAHNVENIAITGKGIIDGSGDAWRYVKRGKMTDAQWKKLVASGGLVSDDGKMWFPSESSKLGHESSSNFNVPDKITKDDLVKVKDFLRPVMVSIVKSDRILLDGPTFQNSPAWNIHPLMSSNIIIRNLDIRNPWYSQNGDGLDLESCKNVLIYNNKFDVGDDAICIKAGKDKDGRDRAIPTENVIIKNNVVYHGHGGFVVGSEMSSGVKNVHVSNCTFIGTDIGLRFKTTRGRGGVVENIYISNIDMINIPAQTIGFNMFYDGNSPIIEEDQSADDEARDEKLVPVTEETPSFRNIFFKGINAINSDEAAYFVGLPEMNLKNIVIEDSNFETKKGITIIDSDEIILKNVTLKTTESGTPVTVYNSKNIDISTLKIDSKEAVSLKVLGKKTTNVTIPENIKKNQKLLQTSNDLPKNAIQ